MPKLLSRKFLIAALVVLSSLIAALQALGVDGQGWVAAAGLISAGLTSLGYSAGQGKVDAATVLSALPTVPPSTTSEE